MTFWRRSCCRLYCWMVSRFSPNASEITRLGYSIILRQADTRITRAIQARMIFSQTIGVLRARGGVVIVNGNVFVKLIILINARITEIHRTHSVTSLESIVIDACETLPNAYHIEPRATSERIYTETCNTIGQDNVL